MISNECKITEFFDAVQGKSIREVIDMACQEATAAERRRLFFRSEHVPQKTCSSEYPDTLKEFIRYIRYSAKPRITKKEKSMLFDSYLKSIDSVHYRD